MANAFVQVPPQSTGLKIQTFENTVGANVVESEAVTLVRSSDNTEVGTSGQPLRVDPTGTTTQPISIVAGQKVEIYDGTNTAAVKAASVAATATDPALVVTTNGSVTAGTCANTVVTSTSSAVVAANVARREVMITNTDIVTVYIGFGQVPTATVYHIALRSCSAAHDGSGGSFVTDTFKGAINAITTSTSGHLAIVELT